MATTVWLAQNLEARIQDPFGVDVVMAVRRLIQAGHAPILSTGCILGISGLEAAVQDSLSEAAMTEDVTYLPIVAEPPYLRVGPLQSPGRSPCNACFLRRRDQRSDQSRVSAAIRGPFNPSGHELTWDPTDIDVISWVALDAIDESSERAWPPGGLLWHHSISGYWSREVTVAHSQCTHCLKHQQEGSMRDEFRLFVEAM